MMINERRAVIDYAVNHDPELLAQLVARLDSFVVRYPFDDFASRYEAKLRV